MTAFDVRASIHAVLAETNLSDPGDIAAMVAQQVPAKELRPVLAVVLRDFIRTEFHRWGGRPSLKPETKGSPLRPRSAKVAAFQRDARAYALVLRKPVAVEGNEWKSFGECTAEDLGYLAADRRQNAAESIASAERFEKYAAAMDETGAATVADLTDEVIGSIEGGAQ